MTVAWSLGLLVITAIAAAIALLFPGTVALGLVLGILPGIVLSLAPSIFVYLLAWQITCWIVLRAQAFSGFGSTRARGGWPVSLAALIVVVIPAVATPLFINAPLRQQIAVLQETDVEPPGTVTLPAIVSVELPASYGEKAPYCEAICLRLLYNRAVSKVIAAEILPDGKLKKSASYRIERRDDCPKPDLPQSLIVWPGEWRVMRGATPANILDRVRARIAGGECLVRDDGRLGDAEASISVRTIRRGLDRFDGPRRLYLDTVGARRLEILGADGRVLYRRTEVTAQPLAVPLQYVVAAALMTTVTYSGWMRSNMEASPLGPDAREVLVDILGEASRPPEPPSPSRRL